MCQELSGLFIRTGDFITDDATCHHELLVDDRQPHEGCRAAIGEPAFIRWEYTPRNGDWQDCELRIDETMVPDWLDDDVMAKLQSACEHYRDSLILTGNHNAVLGRKVIVTGPCKITSADMCTFLVGKDGELELGTISGHIVLDYVYGSVTTGFVDGSVTTGSVYGTGSVTTGDVYGGVTTGNVYGMGSVTTGFVYGMGSVTTGYVEGRVTTEKVDGRVTTGSVDGSVTTGNVYGMGSVTTGYVEGSVTTGYVYGAGSVTINEIATDGRATVGKKTYTTGHVHHTIDS